ncbi:serine/threonine/tyrosine-interacting-like protein 1 isoform X3 [Gadus chalcogrammus]|uniref:serine/threonine/tyrosine-interacting-like protein 1 isoform X3 n=1 Tax=Gadus chalcogrammus TaxID=1042646 RepID=UPI0024C24400|nr:serine/threonine/tyrosine-interacting-like protein 1 isoform X3 [Gadus chalcogrammus]
MDGPTMHFGIAPCKVNEIRRRTEVSRYQHCGPCSCCCYAAVCKQTHPDRTALLNSRYKLDYNTGHIITAKNAQRDSKGMFVVPENVEVESMRHIVVYDSDTSSLKDLGEAVRCAEVLAKELDNFEPYPVEIVVGLLYMADHNQARSPRMCEDLKISAMLNVSSTALDCETANHPILDVCLADSVTADLFSSLKRICVFIGSHVKKGSPVMVTSTHGISRCSAATIAFLMHHFKYTLEDAWKYLKKCKSNMRPNRGFVQQLSDWELHTTGQRSTDISEPNF